MPTIASGNINPGVLMIGEKGADLVRGRAAPPATPAEAAAGNGRVPSRLQDLISDIGTPPGLPGSRAPGGAA
jgi:hypothetical protein